MPRSPAAAYLPVLLSRSLRDGRAGESPGYEQTHRLFYQYHRSRSGHDSMQTRYFLRSAWTAIHRRETQGGARYRDGAQRGAYAGPVLVTGGLRLSRWSPRQGAARYRR